jgi:hypothetical protein
MAPLEVDDAEYWNLLSQYSVSGQAKGKRPGEGPGKTGRRAGSKGEGAVCGGGKAVLIPTCTF